MDALRVAFAALLVLSVSLGGVTAVDFRDRLQSTDDSFAVGDQVTAELVESDLREDRFVATVRLENPTQFDVEVLSARLRVYNTTDAKIVDGPADRLDDNGRALPAGGSLTVTYAVDLTAEGKRDLRGARRNEALLSAIIKMNVGDVEFTYNRKGMDVTEEER